MEQPKGRSHLLPIHHPLHYMYKNIRYFWMFGTVWIGTRFLGSGSILRIVDPMLLEPARGCLVGMRKKGKGGEETETQKVGGSPNANRVGVLRQHKRKRPQPYQEDSKTRPRNK
ncbi:hypothetical protein WN943_020161 [Citrus x changshan-huyou]